MYNSEWPWANYVVVVPPIHPDGGGVDYGKLGK